MTTTATSSSSSTTTTSSSTGEFSRGKTIFVLAVVIGCFAILWPKIFYPMLTASLNVGDDSEQCCDVISEKDGNAYKLMNEICANILKRESSTTPGDTGGPPPALEEPKIEESGQGQQQKSSSSSGRKTYTPPKIRLTTAQLCRNEILKTCGLDVLILIQENPVITKQYKASLAKLRQYNTSQCLKENYGVDFQTVGLPRRFKNSDAHLPPSKSLARSLSRLACMTFVNCQPSGKLTLPPQMLLTFNHLKK
ncbi:unnamed protein product [Allacma fusca]|uniref:Uncharacterized protein n=1 Tax=Allacma fusca TaxID=39272 RepID=A0A8J2Q1C8_9HEXA|nr:unnamed protein product [Allacma fusca]